MAPPQPLGHEKNRMDVATKLGVMEFVGRWGPRRRDLLTQPASRGAGRQ